MLCLHILATLLLLDEQMIRTNNQLEEVDDSPLLAACHPPSFMDKNWPTVLITLMLLDE